LVSTMNFFESNEFFRVSSTKNILKNKKVYAISWIFKLKILMFYDEEMYN